MYYILYRENKVDLAETIADTGILFYELTPDLQPVLFADFTMTNIQYFSPAIIIYCVPSPIPIAASLFYVNFFS